MLITLIFFYVLGYLLTSSCMFATYKKRNNNSYGLEEDEIAAAVFAPFVWPFWFPVWFLYKHFWMKVI